MSHPRMTYARPAQQVSLPVSHTDGRLIVRLGSELDAARFHHVTHSAVTG